MIPVAATMASFLQGLDMVRFSYPMLGLGFVASMMLIPYFYSKSEEKGRKFSADNSPDAAKRRAELWSNASPHARMIAETNLQRLALLLEDAKNDNLDRHYNAAMRGKIYGGMNPRSSKYAGIMPGDSKPKRAE